MSFPRSKDRLFYGWVIVATFFFIGIALRGIRFSFGIFFKSIEDEFNLSRAATSSVFSTYMILGSLFAFIGGWAVDKYGAKIITILMGTLTGLSLVLTSQTSSLWQLYLTYSLLLSMGSSPVYVVLASTISRWFDKKRGMALGIALSGAGAGTVIMAPFATYLITDFDWRTAYLVTGVIALVMVVPFSWLLKSSPREIGALPDGVKPFTEKAIDIPKAEVEAVRPSERPLSELLLTRSAWLIMLTWILFSVDLYLILTHLVPHITDIGYSAEQAASVLSLLGATAIAGRILMGVVSDRIGRKVSTIFCTLLHFAAMMWLIWSRDIWMFYLFALVYGFGYGGFAPTMSALIVDTFGTGRIGLVLGILEFGFGVGAAVGPSVGGLIYDRTGSYSPAFIMGAAAMAIAIFSVALIKQEKGKTPEGR